MKNDPLIDEIREVRHRISASVGHDPHRLVEHYQRLQRNYSRRVTSRHTEYPLEKASQATESTGDEN